jgi:hypothetical protein
MSGTKAKVFVDSGHADPSSNQNGGVGQNVRHGSADETLLNSSLDTNPIIIREDSAIHPSDFDPRISALSDSNSSHLSPTIRPVNPDSQERIQRLHKQQPPKPFISHSLSRETTPVAHSVQVPPELIGSFGFVNDHIAVTWRDLQLNQSSNKHLMDIKNKIEPSQAEGGKQVYSLPSPPSPAPLDSMVVASGAVYRASSSGGNQGKQVSTHNVFPRSMIEKQVQLENVDDLPRLVHRNRAFHQSANKVYVKHNQGTRIFKLLRFNWFHVFLRWPTKWSLLTLVSIWTMLILLFAVVYTAYDDIQPRLACGLGPAGSPIHFAGAFAFSLETCTTVGYTLPFGVNSFFEPECSGLQVIIYFQMIWSMIFNAFLLTFLYNRVGRSESRSTQVIYSNKALVSIVDGQVRFQIRLFDCDAQHPVVEAHVRFYCVMKDRPVPRPMRLLQPNDELGGTLFLSFPTVVCHGIDLFSLLHPPVATMLVKPRGLGLRQVDGATSYRDDVVCPVCGEAFGTFERWWNHVRFQQIVETTDNYPLEGTHRSLDLAGLKGLPGTEPTNDLEQLREYFKGNVSEILCLVEGIDPMQSGTFQALQSYRYEDIVWDANSQFSPCLFLERKGNSKTKGSQIFSVDLDRYHDIILDPGAVTEMDVSATTREVFRIAQPPKHNLRVRLPNVKTVSTRTADSLFEPEVKRQDIKTQVLAEGGIATV